MSLPAGGGMRIDKWLWAARFYKTRALAVEALVHTRVQLNGQACKPAREVKPGDHIKLRDGAVEREIQIIALSTQRGPASVAQQLYAETAQSVAARELAAERERLAPEPARSLTQGRQGRPTKQDRRKLHEWDRWSARADE